MTQDFIQNHTQQGFQVESLTSAMLKNREPRLQKVPEVVAYAEQEGAINSSETIETLLQDAIVKGVIYHPHSEVSALLQNNTQEVIGVSTKQETFYSDKVILTAGINTTELLKPLHIKLPLLPSPAILIHFKYCDNKPISFAQHIISTPEMEVRVLNETTLIAAEDYIDEAPKHNPIIIAQNALTTIKAHFTSTESLEIEKVAVGVRPMQADEMPIIGQVNQDPNLYIISMHAAVTLAPLISRLALQEIILDQVSPELEPYRLSRFHKTSEHH